MKRNTILLCLICWFTFSVSQASTYEPFSNSVPSDQTISSDLPSNTTAGDMSTRFGGGPPTEGSGGGGAVGMPLESGILPIALVGMAYFLLILHRKKKYFNSIIYRDKI